MTIALGILAQGGTVIAADRQETSGSFKSSTRKMQMYWVRDHGTLAVSGAGNGPYIDSITSDLFEWFKKDRDNRISEAVMESELRRQHKKFYRENVLPVSQWEQNDVPDYELLVAYSSSHGDALWTTHKLSVVKEAEFAAVGIGATAAKVMLQRLGLPIMSLEIAVSLAAYIVYQVKRTIDLVGLETDIFEIRDRIPLLVPREDVMEMEVQFREYGIIERNNLFRYFGGDLGQMETIIGRAGDHSQREKQLRAFFESWNEKRRSQFKRQPPIPGESTPRST